MTLGKSFVKYVAGWKQSYSTIRFSIFPTVPNRLQEKDGFSALLFLKWAGQRGSRPVEMPQSLGGLCWKDGGLLWTTEDKQTWDGSEGLRILRPPFHVFSRKIQTILQIAFGFQTEVSSNAPLCRYRAPKHRGAHASSLEGPEALSEPATQANAPFRVPPLDLTPARCDGRCRTACYRDVYAHTPCRL